MRLILSVILTLAVGGCASFIPDYQMNKEKTPKTESAFTITWNPSTYPNFCANSKTPGGKWYRSVSMIVSIQGVPRLVKIVLNEKIFIEDQRAANAHVLRFPAGAGKHHVQVWLLREDGEVWKYAERSFKVFPCGRSTDSFKPADPSDH